MTVQVRDRDKVMEPYRQLFKALTSPNTAREDLHLAA
jgi:hypothetical protein